jgi:hypothetical protein
MEVVLSKALLKGCIVSRVLVAVPLLCGCGEERFPVTPAKGKVVCNGKAVTSGSVTFTPVGAPGRLETGKPASGALGPDGTFQLTTNDRFDGAIVGKHSVRYFGSEGEEEETASSEGSVDERAKNVEKIRQRKLEAQNACVQKGEIVVEVKADGENVFTIELAAPGGRGD